MFSVDDFSAVSINELKSARDWQHQYRLITQWGRLVTVKPEIRIANNLVKGCELPVWLTYRVIDQRYYFAVDCDSRVINGLAVLLLVQLNGKARDELNIEDLESSLRSLGLEKHLTPSRTNGFKSMIKRICQLLA